VIVFSKTVSTERACIPRAINESAYRTDTHARHIASSGSYVIIIIHAGS